MYNDHKIWTKGQNDAWHQEINKINSIQVTKFGLLCIMYPITLSKSNTVTFIILLIWGWIITLSTLLHHLVVKCDQVSGLVVTEIWLTFQCSQKSPNKTIKKKSGQNEVLLTIQGFKTSYLTNRHSLIDVRW